MQHKGSITNIDQIRDGVDIVQVIRQFVDLKQSGNSFTACCPFHDEKTPSFHVTPSKGRFKCFGCGQSGDAFAFVMQHNHLSFPDAVEAVAKICGIEPKYDRKEPADPEASRHIKELSDIAATAAARFQKKLLEERTTSGPGWTYATGRGWTEETIIQWRLGFAPDDTRFLTAPLVEAGRFKPAEEIGLVKSRDGKNYDAFRNRLIFPILNTRGEVVGFGGRDLTGAEKTPKYINSTDSPLYNKSSELYGLYLAQDAIRSRERKCAILVEGYADVVSLQQSGCENTVASCGTALTDDQAKKLRRYTDHVILLRDGDAAGRRAAFRDINVLLPHGFKIEVAVLPDGKDPDDFARDVQDAGGELWTALAEIRQDAILYKAGKLLEGAGDDPTDYARAIEEVGTMLQLISDDVRRSSYIELLQKRLKIKAKLLQSKVKELADVKEAQKRKAQVLGENDRALPAWVENEEELYRYGFVERIDGPFTGYYFVDKGSLVRMTNFVVRPLYHIRSKIDDKRLLEVNNGFEKRIIEMPSRHVVSLENFIGTLFEQGNFVPEGGFGKTHLMKILGKISGSFPSCIELKTLGWQPENFFAFSNFAYNGELKQYDEMGIVEIHGKKFLSMAASGNQTEVRADEDLYRNDRFLSYVSSPIDFSQWAELMVRVYGQNGWMGIAFVLMTIYRDILFNVSKVPHLYAYGAVQAGKSEFGESISALFFKGLPAFNLNQGTDFAFFSRMERYRNCPNTLNEFDENSIKEEWFRAIKSAFDGEGREKGRGIKEKTRTQEILCTLVLMGQYLSTKDDNSVLTRCIPLAFKPVDHRPAEQVAAFRELKEYEKQGLTSILVEFLKHREKVQASYGDTFRRNQRRLSDEIKQAGYSAKSRILNNITAAIAVVEIMATELKLPFTVEQFYEYGKKLIIDISGLVNESNVLSEFWNTVELLLDQGHIREGQQFRIDPEMRLQVMTGRTESMEIDLGETRKVLKLRLNIVHPLFAQEFKRKTGKTAPNMETIRMYMKDRGYLLGTSKGTRFTDQDGESRITSCLLIDYEKIGISLERVPADDRPDSREVSVSGRVVRDAEQVNKDTLRFTLMELVRMQEFPVRNEERFYKCYVNAQPELPTLTAGMNLSVTGWLSERRKDGNIYRQLDVVRVDLESSGPEPIAIDGSLEFQNKMPF